MESNQEIGSIENPKGRSSVTALLCSVVLTRNQPAKECLPAR